MKLRRGCQTCSVPDEKMAELYRSYALEERCLNAWLRAGSCWT